MDIIRRLFAGDPEAAADVTIGVVVIVALLMIWRSNVKKKKAQQVEKDLDGK